MAESSWRLTNIIYDYIISNYIYRKREVNNRPTYFHSCTNQDYHSLFLSAYRGVSSKLSSFRRSCPLSANNTQWSEVSNQLWICDQPNLNTNEIEPAAM